MLGLCYFLLRGKRMSERLDRIEAALEQQVGVNASLRTSVEILKLGLEDTRKSVEALKLGLEDTRKSVEALLQVATIHQGDIETLAQSIRQHRSDGHGA